MTAAYAFAGIGHPAVITVACILVLSRSLQSSGVVDALAQRVLGGAAVAIGASWAFLTPIGHENNTLVVGPGFRFGDYWPLGLPLEILVVAVAVPMLLWMWPL